MILHLLLVPGTAFLTGGAQIWEQNLHPHTTQLNQSLLIIGYVCSPDLRNNSQLIASLCVFRVLTLLLPTAFFAALDRGAISYNTAGNPVFTGPLFTDDVRDQLLQMSRGLAVILLVWSVHLVGSVSDFSCLSSSLSSYIGSRIFLADPPGQDNALAIGPNAPKALVAHEEELQHVDPETNPWACIVLLLITVGIMAATAEWVRLSFLYSSSS